MFQKQCGSVQESRDGNSISVPSRALCALLVALGRKGLILYASAAEGSKHRNKVLQLVSALDFSQQTIGILKCLANTWRPAIDELLCGLRSTKALMWRLAAERAVLRSVGYDVERSKAESIAKLLLEERSI